MPNFGPIDGGPYQDVPRSWVGGSVILTLAEDEEDEQNSRPWVLMGVSEFGITVNITGDGITDMFFPWQNIASIRLHRKPSGE